MRYIQISEVEYKRLKRREKLLLRLRAMIREHWRLVAPIVQGKERKNLEKKRK